LKLQKGDEMTVIEVNDESYWRNIK